MDTLPPWISTAISILKLPLNYLINKILHIQNPECYHMISQHIEMIKDLISKIGKAPEEQQKLYYNLILTMEQTIVQLSLHCY